MSLHVPLTVRINGQHVTRKVEGLAFRKEAVGGLRSISFKLLHPVNSAPDYLQPLTRVDIFDARSAEIVAQGRVSDTGRATDDSGQSWDVVAFGPAQAAGDVTKPKIWIDRVISDGWIPAMTNFPSDPAYTAGVGMSPASGATGILVRFPNGSSLTTNSYAAYLYERITLSGDRLAGISATWDAGMTSASYAVEVYTGTGGTALNLRSSVAPTTAGGSVATLVSVGFPLGEDTVALRLTHTAGGSRLTTDDAWAFWSDVIVEAIRTTSEGVDITAGYTGSTNTGSIVHDLLGSGFLPEFDGANSEITLGATNITQLAYPDGVSAAQVLEDLMAIEPSSRWYTEPDKTGDGYVLRWEPWPTTVRYEATVEDGGSFPMSTQDLYNAVTVTWDDASGRAQTTERTSACAILDDAGLTRHATIAMPADVGVTVAEAEAFGDNFLSERNVPKNGGTLQVARPIRDLQTGRMVEPFEIEAGELVRVRGIESYPDALNADSSDGQSVFRIFAVDYTSDDNRAALALDADPKTTSAALAKLLKQRTRR